MKKDLTRISQVGAPKRNNRTFRKNQTLPIPANSRSRKKFVDYEFLIPRTPQTVILLYSYPLPKCNKIEIIFFPRVYNREKTDFLLPILYDILCLTKL